MKTIIIFLMLFPCLVIAQENQNNANQPLDLQEFVITGKASSEVKGGTKQKPAKPGLMTKMELDSINTNNKVPSPLLLAVPLPISPLKPYSVKGYAGGEFGLFSSPKLYAGYSFSAGGYAVDVFGNYESSVGHLDNAGFNTYGLSLNASYDAPAKFIFFGGSRTESSLKYNAKNYTLFGADKNNVFDRSVNNAGASVDIKGKYEEYSYKAGALWESLSLETNGANQNDSRIMGYLSLQKPFEEYLVSANVLLDLHSLERNSYNFMEFGAGAEWNKGDFSLKSGVKIQSALNTNDESLFGVNIHASGQYRLNEMFTSNVDLYSGMSNASMSEYLGINPYMLDSSLISFRKDNIRIKPSIVYHPSIDMSASLSLEYASISALPVFLPNSTESGKFAGFSIAYLGASTVKLMSEAMWKPFKHTTLMGMVSYFAGNLSESNVAIPMMPTINAGLKYDRQWDENFHSQLSAEYIGTRYVDTLQSNELSGYVLINVRLRYMLQSNLEAYFRLDNLLNSPIYIWNRFRERGTFVAIGIRYTI